MAYGKHYIENDFMFSQALIEAYQLECMEAKYPRIIILPNLKDLYAPKCEHIPGVIKEKDGYYFINYFASKEKEKLREILQNHNLSLPRYTLRVRKNIIGYLNIGNLYLMRNYHLISRGF